MSTPFALLAGALLSALAVAQDPPASDPAPTPEWLQDFAQARTKAKADQKDLLVDFTGSDWCVWCQRLDKEVFAEPVFQSGIAKGYVLVKLDYPRDPALVTDEVRAQNETLQKDYGVQGYPTIFLMDADGRPYAQTGYQRGGPEKYLEHLAGLQRAKAGRDEHFAKAKDAQGVARAQHLAAGLDALGEDLAMQHYGVEIKEVIALDADNGAGLKDKYTALLDKGEQQKIVMKLQQQVNELASEGKWDELDKSLDETLKANAGRKQVEQLATFFKAIAAIEGKQDYAKGLELIDAAKKVDPDSEMGKRLDTIRQNIETMKAEKDKEKGGKEAGK